MSFAAPIGAAASAGRPLASVRAVRLAHQARPSAGAVRHAAAHATRRRSRRRHGFPVPTCRWVPASLVTRTLGVRVRALAPHWSLQIAPVLTCAFVERTPELQFGNVPIVAVQFRELQRFHPARGSVYVRHLGSCIVHSSCPVPRKPAFQLVGRTTSGTPPYFSQFVSGIDLRVEDGLNFLRITVANPDGPLPIGNEVAGVHRLARALLPKFYWK